MSSGISPARLTIKIQPPTLRQSSGRAYLVYCLGFNSYTRCLEWGIHFGSIEIGLGELPTENQQENINRTAQHRLVYASRKCLGSVRNNTEEKMREYF
jgi:hypothetical protein